MKKIKIVAGKRFKKTNIKRFNQRKKNIKSFKKNKKKITKKIRKWAINPLINVIVKKILLKTKKVSPPKKVKTRRSKSVGKIYFDETTEKAITTYNNLPDWAVDERNEIFEKRIKLPFEKLVENVFNTFKFSYFETSPQDVQKETISHLVANMHKYDKLKGKAFSYFSIVAKHFLIHQNNSNYKRFNQNVDISEERDENTVQLQSVDTHNKETEMREFMKLIVDFWDNNIDRIFNKEKDLVIAKAVVELLRSSDRIDSFNKKALYLYIREISCCKTQQITKIINRMKQYQLNMSKSYKNEGYVNTERGCGKI